jgi:hypothetical protein
MRAGFLSCDDRRLKTDLAASADGPPKQNGTGNPDRRYPCGQAFWSNAMQWRSPTTGDDAMRGTGDDEISYATGWTISGLATLGTIVAIWLLGI